MVLNMCRPGEGSNTRVNANLVVLFFSKIKNFEFSYTFKKKSPQKTERGKHVAPFFFFFRD